MLFHRRIFYNAPADNGGGGTPPEGDPKAGGALDFAVWLESQSDEVKTAYQAHTTGLQTALKSERDKSKGVADRLKRLDELEEAEAKRQGEKLTEKEKLEKQLAEKDRLLAESQAKAEEAQQRVNQTRLNAEVRIVAQALGFADLGDVEKLADLSAVEITDEKITGVEDALKALAKAKPYLVKADDTTKKPGTPPGKGPKPPKEPTEPKPRRPLVRL